MTTQENETTNHGNMIARSIDMMSNKMDYHYKYLNLDGWCSINVDSGHLGYWFNEKAMRIFCFCEGSIAEYVCVNVESFLAEMADIRHFVNNNL